MRRLFDRKPGQTDARVLRNVFPSPDTEEGRGPQGRRKYEQKGQIGTDISSEPTLRSCATSSPLAAPHYRYESTATELQPCSVSASDSFLKRFDFLPSFCPDSTPFILIPHCRGGSLILLARLRSLLRQSRPLCPSQGL